MDTKQRFLRRAFLKDHMEIFLRESNYHRNNDESEKLPGRSVWSWDEQEGECGEAF